MQPFPSFAKREVSKKSHQIFFRAPTWSISPTNSWSSPSVGAQPNVRITCTCQKSCCSKSPKEKLVLLTKNQTNDRFTFSFQKFVKIGHLPKLNSGDGAATVPEQRKLEKWSLSDFCNIISSCHLSKNEKMSLYSESFSSDKPSRAWRVVWFLKVIEI